MQIEVPAVDLFCVAFSPDERPTLATGGFAGNVQLWDLATRWIAGPRSSSRQFPSPFPCLRTRWHRPCGLRKRSKGEALEPRTARRDILA